MNRVVGAIVIVQVTTGLIAGSRIYAVIPVDMALRAGSRRIGVFTRQREARVAVVECRIRPIDRVVARIASLREPGGDVIGYSAAQCCRAVPVGRVARVTRRAVQSVIVARVALIAIGDHARRRHLVIAS